MPSYGWQKFIVTTKARNQVNRYLKKIHDEESVKLGKEILTKTLRRMKLMTEKDVFLKAFNRFGYADERSLLIAIGTGVLTVREIFQNSS